MPLEREDVDRSEGLGAAHGCASPGGLGHDGEVLPLQNIFSAIICLEGHNKVEISFACDQVTLVSAFGGIFGTPGPHHLN